MYSKKIYPTYVSKHNSNHEKQIIILMIANGKGQWHNLVVKKLSVLVRGIKCIVWITFISLEFKANLNRIKEYVKVKIFVM